jgi:hypothetical protein
LGATTPREAMDEMGSSSGSGSGSADENVPLGGHARGGKRYDASASRSIAAEEEEDAEEETLAGLRKSMKAAQTRAVANASANGATPTSAQGRGLAALRERKGFQRMDARAVIEATPEPDARADVVPIAPALSPSDEDDDDEIDLPGLDDPPAPVATKAARGDDAEAMKEATDADAGRPHPGSRAAFESKTQIVALLPHRALARLFLRALPPRLVLGRVLEVFFFRSRVAGLLPRDRLRGFASLGSVQLPGFFEIAEAHAHRLRPHLRLHRRGHPTAVLSQPAAFLVPHLL